MNSSSRRWGLLLTRFLTISIPFGEFKFPLKAVNILLSSCISYQPLAILFKKLISLIVSSNIILFNFGCSKLESKFKSSLILLLSNDNDFGFSFTLSIIILYSS